MPKQPLYKTSRLSTYNSGAKFRGVTEDVDQRMITVVGCTLMIGAVIAAVTLFLMSLKNPSRGCGCGKSARVGGVAAGGEAMDIKSDEDLDAAIKTGEKVFVMFHAPWCGHCKTTKGPFKEAATRGGNTMYALADCANDITPKALAKYNIEGFPTLKLFSGGVEKTYSGPRNADSFVDFCK